MLHTLNELDGFHIHATDGFIGTVRDFYFDDKQWVIRYFIVQTGIWLDNRKVLLTPISITYLNLEEKIIKLSITMNQVKNSPLIDTKVPVTQQYEIDYLSYYGYPFYWGNTGLWGAFASPGMNSSESAESLLPRKDDLQIAETFVAIDTVRRRNGDRHLRSCKEIQGYYIQGIDAEIGNLQGMLVDEDTWAVRYLIVLTSSWWVGHQVLLSPSWIRDINWGDAKISVEMEQQLVKDAPLFDPNVSFSHQNELSLHDHYGRTGYWQEYAKAKHE